MFQTFKTSLLAGLLAGLVGCSQNASMVSEPLQPLASEPAAYLVGSIGPKYLALSTAENQRLLFRKRGSQYGAAGVWMSGTYPTSEDVRDADGTASVFVLPLKPGDYEFYDFQFYSSTYQPGLGTIVTSRQAREKFNMPMRLEAGKAYYLGEFRSTCIQQGRCMFLWRDEMGRDGAIAKRQHPEMPAPELLHLDMKAAASFIMDDTASKSVESAARIGGQP